MSSPFDATLILGGGLDDSGEPRPWVIQRLDRAVESDFGEPMITCSAGTPHRPPPLDSNGHPIFECTAMAAYLLGRGVQRSRIYRENASFDTLGSAYLTRMIHTEPRGWRRLRVITSAFHMARAEFAFRWVYSLDNPNLDYQFAFESTPDDRVPEPVLNERTTKERSALDGLRKLAANITSLESFHQWLFTEHTAYSAVPYFATLSNDELRQSY